MIGYILAELGDLLKQVGLYHLVSVMQYGLPAELPPFLWRLGVL